VPIYEQLRRGIIELIIKGVLKENDQLPSIRNLAKELSINPNTIAKAYQSLERDKIIYSTMGRGSFVSPVNETIIKKQILSEFDEYINEAMKAGITKEELIERINSITG
jgi:GntR family transcriptional regulator